MITNGIYFNNNEIYYEDLIININKPELFKKQKNIIFIVNNTTKLDKYKDNIPLAYKPFTPGLPIYYMGNFKVIYTSEIFKVLCNNFNNHIKYNASDDSINKIDKILNILCIQKNQLNIIVLISDEKILLKKRENTSNINIVVNELNTYYVNGLSSYEDNIKSIIYDTNIKIVNSNINKLIGTTNTFNVNSDNLLIFLPIKIKNINFINYIEYQLEGFDDISIYVNLEYDKHIDFNIQVAAIQNIIIDYLNCYLQTKYKFELIKIKVINTLNYYHYILTEEEKIHIKDTISDINMQFNNLQFNKIKDDIKLSVPQDNLFSKSLIITKSHIKNKLFRIYIKNRYKINNKLICEIDNNILNNSENNSNLEKSLDFYTSSISLSNWHDELKSKSCLGLLINVSGIYSDKMGYTSDTINIINITNTLISPEQIYDGHQYFWDKYNKLDNGKHPDNILSGSAIGKGNSLIPLYINKYHWSSAKEHLEENISIALTQNPYLFKPIMMDIYSHVLLKFISYVLIDDFSDKNIKLLISFIITMKHLNLDKIQYCYDDFSHIHNLRPLIASFCIEYISGNINFNQNEYNNYFLKLHEEITKRNMRANYKKKEILHNLLVNNLDDPNNITSILITFLNSSINSSNIDELEHVWSFCKIINSDIMNEIFLKYENNYGWLEDDDILEFKNKIKENMEFFNFEQILNYGESYNDVIKYYILQTFLTRSLKLKKKFLKSNSIVNIFDSNSIELCKKNYNNLLKIII
jgi:hypothetical protein